jgi:cell shape-determining protein MreD
MIRKYGYVWFLITLFAVLQPSIFMSLNISVYMPDFVAVILAAQAFTRSIKVSVGFAVYAGILVDLTSPIVSTFGISVIAYIALVLIINLTVQAPHDNTWLPVAAAGFSPTLVITVRAILVFLTSGANLSVFYPSVLVSQLLFGLVAAAFLVPLMDRLDQPLLDDLSLPRVRL